MKVFIDKREIQKLKRRMLKAYPKERIELLWGKFKKPDEFHVYVFDQIPFKSTSKSLEHDESEYQISSDHAQSGGLTLLGSIHSHPDCDDAAPSEFDYDESIKTGELISGIVCINVNKSGKKRTIRLRFWGPLQSIEVEYF